MLHWISTNVLVVVAGWFLLIAFLEARAPRHPVAGVASRWLANFGLYAAALATLHALPRIGWPSGLASWDDVLVRMVGPTAGLPVAFVLGFLFMDLLGYLLHRMQHLGPFWRLHHVHHADHELDASTGLRHHPGETVVNAVIGAGATALLGVPVWVLPIYVLVAELASLPQHANVAVPPRVDRALSSVAMTPEAHRLHHSDAPEHFDANFGALLTIWDRAFGTWHAPVEARLRFGVAGVGQQGLLRALVAPVRRLPPADQTRIAATRQPVEP